VQVTYVQNFWVYFTCDSWFQSLLRLPEKGSDGLSYGSFWVMVQTCVLDIAKIYAPCGQASDKYPGPLGPRTP
jgi:hypothetical protein